MKLQDALGTCPAYYRPYLDTLEPEMELLPLMERQLANFPRFLQSIPEDQWGYAYAPGKWTVAEALVHVLDTERVFQYRALCFGRKDSTPLPGFDQDAYVPHSRANQRTISDVLEEYQLVRGAGLALFRTFTEEDLQWQGTASGVPMPLGTLGFIMCAHQRHHRNILRERYLGS